MLNINYPKSKIYVILLKSKNIWHNELPPSQARTAQHRIIEMVKMNSRKIDGILVDVEVQGNFVLYWSPFTGFVHLFGSKNYFPEAITCRQGCVGSSLTLINVHSSSKDKIWSNLFDFLWCFRRISDCHQAADKQCSRLQESALRDNYKLTCLDTSTLECEHCLCTWGAGVDTYIHTYICALWGRGGYCLRE